MSGSVDKGMYRVLHVVGKGMSVLSGLLFSSSDRAAARHLAASLSEDVRRDWAYVLEVHRGEVETSAPRRTSFDYALCEVTFPELVVRVSRGRRELRVQVASPSMQGTWEDLSSVLSQHARETAPPHPEDGLIAFGNALDAHWKAIVAAIEVSR